MCDPGSCADTARQLGDLLAQLPVGDAAESWKKIEIIAQSLANGLRVRNSEHFSFSISYQHVHANSDFDIALWLR